MTGESRDVSILRVAAERTAKREAARERTGVHACVLMGTRTSPCATLIAAERTGRALPRDRHRPACVECGCMRGIFDPAHVADDGVGKTTAIEYLRRAATAGGSWPLPEGLDEAALERLLFPPPSPSKDRQIRRAGLGGDRM